MFSLFGSKSRPSFKARTPHRNGMSLFAEALPTIALLSFQSVLVDDEIAEAARNPSQSPQEMARISQARKKDPNAVTNIQSGVGFTFAKTGDGVIDDGATEDAISGTVRHTGKVFFAGLRIKATGPGAKFIQSIELVSNDGQVLASSTGSADGTFDLVGFLQKGTKKVHVPGFKIRVTASPEANGEEVILRVDMGQIRKASAKLIPFGTIPNAQDITLRIGNLNPVVDPVDPPIDPVSECVGDFDGNPTLTQDVITITGLVTAQRVDVYAPVGNSVTAGKITLVPNQAIGVIPGDLRIFRANPNSSNVNISVPINGTVINADGTWTVDFEDFVVPAQTNELLEVRANLQSGDTLTLSLRCVSIAGLNANVEWVANYEHAPAPVNPNPTVYLITDPTPFQTTDAISSLSGERIGLQVELSAPAFESATLYFVNFSGDTSGATNLRLTRSDPNGVNADFLVPTTLVTNPDGTKQLLLLAPYEEPQATVGRLQVRFDLTGGQHVDLKFESLGVSEPAAVANWTDDINWN